MPKSDYLQIRCTGELKKAVKEAAEKNGCSIAEQARLELSMIHGIEPKQPYLPEPLRALQRLESETGGSRRPIRVSTQARQAVGV